MGHVFEAGSELRDMTQTHQRGFKQKSFHENLSKLLLQCSFTCKCFPCILRNTNLTFCAYSGGP